MKRVLIVEDDLMIADLLEEILLGGGYDVCGIARTVAEAVALGNLHKPDLAIIDVRLAKGEGTEIAALLTHKPGILYATGNVDRARLMAADGIGYLSKPYRPSDVIPALRIVEQFFTTGTASPPFPPRFTMLREYA
jgi:DNA-binding response OmpR family regulator